MKVISESVKFLKIVIPAGQTGVFKPTAPLEPRSDIVIRHVSISANKHDETTEISVFAGQHLLIDKMPDLQAFDSATHTDPEKAPRLTSSQKITAEAVVSTLYTTQATIQIAVAYWIVLP